MRSLLVVLCALPALAAPDVKEALLQADRDFDAATQEKRAEGWMQFMDDDAVMQRQKPVVGKDAIRAAVEKDWAEPSFKLTWSPDEAFAMPNGRMGYTRGRWTLTATDPKNGPLKVTGTYLTVWRLDKQGRWKVIWDGGSPDPRP